MSQGSIKLIWGVTVQFDTDKRNLKMTYYGISLFNIFIGIGIFINENIKKQQSNTGRMKKFALSI